MADRGFIVADSLGAVRATLHIPSFTKGKDQLTALEVKQTRSIANMFENPCRTCHWMCTAKVHNSECHCMVCYQNNYVIKRMACMVMLDVIVCVCCALNNMSKGIIATFE